MTTSSWPNKTYGALLLLMEHAEEHPEWVVIVAFHKAVQIVEAVLANHRGYDSNSHDRRIEQLKHPEFKEIFKAYRPLFGASLIARYLEDSTPGKLYERSPRVAKYRKFTDHTPADRVIDRFVRRRLAAIEQHAIQFLCLSGRIRRRSIRADGRWMVLYPLGTVFSILGCFGNVRYEFILNGGVLS